MKSPKIDPETRSMIRLYVREQKSTRDIAAILGRGDATIRRRLHAAGIALRSNVPRSRLIHLNQARLFASIAENGIPKTAKRWHIHKQTLKRYVSKIRKADRRQKGGGLK